MKPTRLLVPTLRIAAAMAIVAIVAALGLGDSVDRMLHRPYYQVRGERATDQRVLLVAIDAPTVAAWGAPPWRGTELSQMLATVSNSQPRVVGLVDDPARLLAGQTLPAAVIAGPVALDLEANAVERVHVEEASSPTAPARIATAAGFTLDGKINYIGKRGLPTVSAIDVARGAIPPATFAGKIVVVGLTAQPYAGLVPTPIGPLAPSQVQAHALASTFDGVVWSTPPALVRWLILGLLCALAFWMSHRFTMTQSTVATAGIVAALVILDYLMFRSGTVLWGATLPVLTVFTTALIERVAERISLHRDVRDVAHWTRRWMLHETMREANVDDEPRYWRRVGDIARLYLGASSSIIAELPAGQHHLEVRVLGNLQSGQIRERRMDVRRSPYRKAHVTLGPVWHDGFMTDGTRTLLVPLIVRNTNLIGFWMVSFANREAVTPAHLALIKTLAQEIALALERRRDVSEPQRGFFGKLFAARPFSVELDDVKRAFHEHARNQQDLLTLGESMPFGVFVTTLWGEVRYANGAMKKLCTERTIDLASTDADLAELLASLTGRGAPNIHNELRELVQTEHELYLRGDRDDVVLSWLKTGDDSDERLVVGWVLPGSAQAQIAGGGEAKRPVEEHAVTVLRRKAEMGAVAPRLDIAIATFAKYPAVTDDQMTIPRPKLDPSEVVVGETNSNKTVKGHLNPSGNLGSGSGNFAQGTPTFRASPHRLDPEELFGGETLVPDPTLKAPKVIVEDLEDTEDKAATPPRETKRLFDVKFDA